MIVITLVAKWYL